MVGALMRQGANAGGSDGEREILDVTCRGPIVTAFRAPRLEKKTASHEASMETLTMLTWKRRAFAVLPGMLWILSGCASDQTTETPAAQTSAPLGSRLETLRLAAAPAAVKDAWGADYLRGLVVERAWVSGGDLLLEAFNPGTRNYELQSVDVKTGVPNWVLVVGPQKLKVDPRPGDRLLALLTENDAAMTVVDRRTGARTASIRAKLGLATTQPLASSDSSVFVSSLGTNRIASLNPADARVGWAYLAPTVITAGPVMTPRLPRRLAVAACFDGTVVAIPAHGFDEGGPEAPAWSRRLLGSVSGDLAVATAEREGKLEVSILVPCEDRGLYCLDAATGESRWVFRTESAFQGTPVVLNGVVFCRNGDRLCAIKLADGTAAWPSSDPAAAPTMPWESATEALALDDARGYLRGADGRVWRVDGKTGRPLSSARLDAFDMVLGGGSSNLLLGITKDGYAVAFK
jgi:outer membrane protein assembly factor BamB